MSIKIVVDSACDLPESLVQELGISVVPMFIHQGDQEYRDGIDISRETFYEQCLPHRPLPTTATLGVDCFKQVYQQLVQQGATHILSIHLSIKLSGVVNVARQAAQETRNAAVTVLDSQQLSLGAGFLAIRAAQTAAAGHSLDEILSILDEQISRTTTFAALDTLEYLKPGGRMNSVILTLGTLLRIKPLLRMHRGQVTSEKVRTRKNAAARLIQILGELGPLEKVAMVHTHSADRAEALLKQVQDLLPPGEVLRAEISPVLGAHIGPGVVGFVCITQAKS